MSSEEIYRKTMETGTPKLKRSLRAIKSICDDLQLYGNKIYPAKVGKECERRFGSPKLQSIRNNGILLEYITLREKEQGDVAGENRSPEKGEETSLLDTCRRENTKKLKIHVKI